MRRRTRGLSKDDVLAVWHSVRTTLDDMKRGREKRAADSPKHCRKCGGVAYPSPNGKLPPVIRVCVECGAQEAIEQLEIVGAQARPRGRPERQGPAVDPRRARGQAVTTSSKPGVVDLAAWRAWWHRPASSPRARPTAEQAITSRLQRLAARGEVAALGRVLGSARAALVAARRRR